jgi:hypothetical protein
MLYYVYHQGGDNIIKLINIFFIVYIINLLITLYSIYTFFDNYLFYNLQGSKLKLKKHLLQNKEDHY